MKISYTPIPDYADQLVLYEIATKGFTSPNGPESGTFASLGEKIPYLATLGITGIWLTGHQWCDPTHFYNIWTEYACIRPDVLDPSLGTEDDFKSLVEAAHQQGIRVFLDVITHGVMEDSPLVKEHPDWFLGGTWGMVDFDWYGNHPDLEDWWVKTWVDYVVRFGVDGYRLDVDTYRYDLWSRIRQQAKAAGREIMVISEHTSTVRGAVDMSQNHRPLGWNMGLVPQHPLTQDVAGYMNAVRQDVYATSYLIDIAYTDGCLRRNYEIEELDTLQFPEIPNSLNLVCLEDVFEDNVDALGGVDYTMQWHSFRIDNADIGSEIQSITLRTSKKKCWKTGEPDFRVRHHWEDNLLFIQVPVLDQKGQLLSTQLSCHDCGWVGFPKGESAYTAKGSRLLMGYASMLTPAVPIMMAGEEFNAEYRPLPQHAPGLFGEGEKGEGTWLYGGWLDWQQAAESPHAEMLEDTQCILHIRQRYAQLIRPMRMGEEPEVPVVCVGFGAKTKLPVPYAYKGEDCILLVAANPSEKSAVDVTFVLTDLLQAGSRYRVGVEFGSGAQWIGDAQECSKRVWTIAPDKTPGGGLLVLVFEKQEG